MRIRWKLFWLLAAISLGPILLLRISSQLSFDRLADRLSKRVGAHLVAEAETSLGRLVEDHARLLASRRQSLALAVVMQAMAVEEILATPAPPLDPATVVIVDAVQGMGHRQGAQADSAFTPSPASPRSAPDGTAPPQAR